MAEFLSSVRTDGSKVNELLFNFGPHGGKMAEFLLNGGEVAKFFLNVGTHGGKCWA